MTGPAAPHPAGLVLAAGAGRRMGQPKAVLQVGGTPLVGIAVHALVGGGCAPVAAVVGAGADRVPLPDGVTALRNARWAEGQSTSVAVGLGWAVDVAAPAVVVLPVDTPGIGPAVVGALLAAWQAAGCDPAAVLVATYDGAPRNPVLLGRDHLADVSSSLTGDEGARRWLAANTDLVVAVECGALGDPHDLDTPDDLARWA